MTKRNKVLCLVAACGAAASVSGVAFGNPEVVNISGATLFDAFFPAPASTNDFIDVDGDGNSRSTNLTNDQLARDDVTTFGANDWWVVQYHGVGSGNGLAELVSNGQIWVNDDHTGSLPGDARDTAYSNREQFHNSDLTYPPTATFPLLNLNNPGGSPITTGNGDWTARNYNAGVDPDGYIQIDIAVIDVPVSWFVTVTGSGNPFNNPTAVGYGDNPTEARDPVTGAPSGQGNKLKSLGNLNQNPVPDANTVFDTPVAFVPIASLTNYGTGVQEIRLTDLQHLVSTGRMRSGENFVFVTRDSGSGTRNGWTNSVCIDPSWGVGENVGVKNNEGPLFDLVGPTYLPSNKGGSSRMEGTVTNTRLGMGYTGAERGDSSSRGWLDNDIMEVMAVQNDFLGGTEFSRPTADDIVFNDVDGYIIGGPETFATIGDPRNETMPGGEPGNTNPAVNNAQAAAYLNNITRSIESAQNFTAVDDFSPGELLATQFILTAATDNAQDLLDPCNLVVNPEFNQDVQNFTRSNSVLNSARFASFNTNAAGLVPTRRTGFLYTDGVANGANYIDQTGGAVTYGSVLTMRNKIAGDMNGDGTRDWTDTADLVAAYRDRVEAVAWSAPDGVYGSNAGDDAIIEVLMDFDCDGNITRWDVAYFADGLAVDPSTRLLDRREGFTRVDNAYPGGNFFGINPYTTGESYKAGDARADIAGSGVHLPGFAPRGADQNINAADIDYVNVQFRQNANILDGELDWDDLLDAVDADLSADLTGDLLVNEDDITEIVNVILCTRIGDVNLDGVVDNADIAIVDANNDGSITSGGSWAQGDTDGDGDVDSDDENFVRGVAQCPADLDGDFAVLLSDFGVFSAAFGSTGLPCYTGGDLDGDGQVLLSDFGIFAGQFGCQYVPTP